MRVAPMVVAILLAHGVAKAQSPVDESAPALSPVASLGLSPDKVSHLNRAVAEHDYIAAEKLLLEEPEINAHSARAARLLAYAGSIYFLNHDDLNAAIAWKKSDAIAPLDLSLQFSLAMAYVGMGRSDWARSQLAKLAGANPKEAIYPYWLGRLEFDAQHYDAAIDQFKMAAQLSPTMMRSYDKLGLCYFYLNQNAEAMESFNKAIVLNRNSPHPSAWPYVDAAMTLQFLNRLPEAEANLREAVKIDPAFAEAHYRLGGVLEDQDHPEAALPELVEATQLDQHYAEPHMVLARIYKKLGRKDDADREVQTYLKLHREASKRP